MIKKDKILISVLAVLFIAYVVVEQYAPEPLQWVPTFSPSDKQPYGGYILYDRLEDFFMAKGIEYETLYQDREDSINVVIIAESFKPSKEDIDALFASISYGKEIFIAADIFGKQFLDTLELKSDLNIGGLTPANADSVALTYGGNQYFYPSAIVRNRVIPNAPDQWQVHAKVDDPVLISRSIGDGRLFLSSTPLAFTNYGILRADNHEFVEHAFGLMSPQPIVYNRFYQTGRNEPKTPFRYLLSQGALRWALYLTLFGILLLLVIDSRRRQRMIPLLDPKQNTTLRYIKTMGGLYYRERNHKRAAEKIIVYFLKSLSERYYMRTLFSESAYRSLAHKTGLGQRTVIETFELIQRIRTSNRISEEQLKELQEKITLYNLKKHV